METETTDPPADHIGTVVKGKAGYALSNAKGEDILVDPSVLGGRLYFEIRRIKGLQITLTFDEAGVLASGTEVVITGGDGSQPVALDPNAKGTHCFGAVVTDGTHRWRVAGSRDSDCTYDGGVRATPRPRIRVGTGVAPSP